MRWRKQQCRQARSTQFVNHRRNNSDEMIIGNRGTEYWYCTAKLTRLWLFYRIFGRRSVAFVADTTDAHWCGRQIASHILNQLNTFHNIPKLYDYGISTQTHFDINFSFALRPPTLSIKLQNAAFGIQRQLVEGLSIDFPVNPNQRWQTPLKRKSYP